MNLMLLLNSFGMPDCVIEKKDAGLKSVDLEGASSLFALGVVARSSSERGKVVTKSL